MTLGELYDIIIEDTRRKMIEIEDKIVSADLLRECFACDLGVPRHLLRGGQCGCTAGGVGARRPGGGVRAIQTLHDARGHRRGRSPGLRRARRGGRPDHATLVAGAECAYACRENGVTLCAIERAWRDGRTEFRKPVSCHLYPHPARAVLRTARSDSTTIAGTCALRPHACGRKLGVPVYKALLRTPSSAVSARSSIRRSKRRNPI